MNEDRPRMDDDDWRTVPVRVDLRFGSPRWTTLGALANALSTPGRPLYPEDLRNPVILSREEAARLDLAEARGNVLSRAGLEDSSIGEPTVRCRYCPYVRVRRSLDEYDRLRVRALDVEAVEEAGAWWLRHSLGRVGPFTSPVEARIYALDRLWRLR